MVQLYYLDEAEEMMMIKLMIMEIGAHQEEGKEGI